MCKRLKFALVFKVFFVPVSVQVCLLGWVGLAAEWVPVPCRTTCRGGRDDGSGQCCSLLGVMVHGEVPALVPMGSGL